MILRSYTIFILQYFLIKNQVVDMINFFCITKNPSNNHCTQEKPLISIPFIPRFWKVSKFPQELLRVHSVYAHALIATLVPAVRGSDLSECRALRVCKHLWMVSCAPVALRDEISPLGDINIPAAPTVAITINSHLCRPNNKLIGVAASFAFARNFLPVHRTKGIGAYAGVGVLLRAPLEH